MIRNKGQRILLVASEVHPFARTGGLADMTFSFAKALDKAGYEVAIAQPLYRKVFPPYHALKEIAPLKVPIGDEIKNGFLYKSWLEETIPVWLIEQNDYFDREYLYGNGNGDYPDNPERFAFFCRGILSGLQQINWRPDIIHCNDWQTALIPLYKKIFYGQDSFYQNTGTLFTIHNLAYQGVFPKAKLKALGLGEEFFNLERLEFYGNINMMKAGIIYADLLNTVSPNYARQIQTKEYGCGLDGLLRKRKVDLYGIINGIDCDFWNPQNDIELIKHFSVTSLDGKNEDKIALQRENNLPVKDVPLVGMVSRLIDQKGLDLVVEAFNEMVKLPIQFILIGQGDSYYQNILSQLQNRFPKSTNIHIGFDIATAKRIYAGSDILLMPSKFEPCGIAQLIGMRYGTIPVVRKTGGLVDTVKEFDIFNEQGNGFLFKNYSGRDLIDALRKVSYVFHDKDIWERLIRNVMQEDFSWEVSIRGYNKVYNMIHHKMGKFGTPKINPFDIGIPSIRNKSKSYSSEKYYRIGVLQSSDN
jgi:starch synthase